MLQTLVHYLHYRIYVTLVMNPKTLIACIVISVFFLSSQAQQNVPFEKEYFKERKAEFKEARRQLLDGDEFFLMGRGQYLKALPFYQKANKFNPNNAGLNLKIGKCYLEGAGSTYKIKSLDYLQKAYKLDPRVDADIFYLLGRAYHLKSEWDKAINEYKKFQRTFGPNTSMNRKARTVKRIQECKNGKELVKKPVRVFIDNMGGVVNSKYPDYGAIITADESVMIFTSRRDNTTGGKIDAFINQYMEDLYITEKINGQWTPPKTMGKPVNTDGHDAIVGLSADGQKLLVYIDDKGDGNIYECVLRGDEWSKPRKLGKTINTKYTENDACFSPDGQILYFVSEKPEGSFGGLDIYMSRWDYEDEKWGVAQNLGPTINTKYDDRSVFMHPDGKTLYFSSQAHKTMGEFDIFKSVFENGRWSTPENIGYPINSPDDDVYFVLSASGKRGYYTSFSPDGYGEKDLFVITFLGPEKAVMLNTEDNLIASKVNPVKETIIEPAVIVSRNRVTILKGIVRNAVTLRPLGANIELIDNEKSELVAKFTSNSKTGKYLVSLPSGKNYGIAVTAEGYLFHSEHFNIPEEAAYKEVVKNFDLQKLGIGNSIILKNIFFDYDKFTLRPESNVELERLRKLLSDNPTLKVEISGHTDNVGSDQYNNKLSENRAQAVVNRLIGMGINAGKMTYKGYGESKSIASNDTDEGRQLNRRTEFKIIGL